MGTGCTNDLFDVNLAHYEKLYCDPFERRSFEVRSKTQIFDSLRSKYLNSPAGKKALDAGFGSGDILCSLSRKGADCWGTEIARNAISALSSRCPTFNILESRISSLPFEDNFFDLLVCSHVLEHESDEKAAMKEMIRVLKPGGLLFLGVPGAAVGETELHARLYKKCELYGFSSSFGVDLLDCREYGSRLFQSVYYFISGIAASNSRVNSGSSGTDKIVKYSFVRRLYHYLVVPALLFLYRLDSMAAGKARPIEIWAVLKKKYKEAKE
ncbi:MAG: class I SAM-dependent methyltransferase [Candidatus Omnitrophica bacterium]|nr:class I SAM-dependent methyltransferase [Candidatus Omnitrophota bacterium]MDD5552664.1 class I SAM-dependent methyltransferase [Candidatus Omnitrophota bacterium]